MTVSLVAVLAVSIIACGALASGVGPLAGRLRTTYPTYAVWTLNTMIWYLAMAIVYSVLALPLNLLLGPLVFARVLPVVYLSARWGYRFSKPSVSSTSSLNGTD